MDFDSAYTAFLESWDTEQAYNRLESLIRLAFKAGWMLRGGEAVTPAELLDVYGDPEKYMTGKKVFRLPANERKGVDAD
mgnify:CR=1 FL=1